MQKKATEPSIRFAGFRNGWEKRKFDSIFTFLNNNTLSRAFMRDEGSGTKNIHYGDILVKFGECLNVSKDGLPCIKNDAIVATARNSTLKDGDVIFADTAEDETAGKCVEIYNVKEEDVLAGLHTIPCRPSISFGNAYLGYCLNSVAFHAQLLSLMQGIKVLSISKNALSSTNLTFPLDKIEQGRIGNFFLLMDELITLHQRKYEKLVNLKKALLDKVFPKNGELVPEVRFAGFSGNWERRKLGDMAEFKRGLTYNPSDVVTHGVRVLRSSNIDGDTFVLSDDDVFVKPSAANIPIVQKGDILITAANGSSKLVGKHAMIDYMNGKMVHGGFMLLAHPHKHSSYVNALISAPWYADFIQTYIAGGNGAIGNLKMSDLSTQTVCVCSDEEQEKIGDCFSNLNGLIALQHHKLERLQCLKNAFLDKMFV